MTLNPKPRRLGFDSLGIVLVLEAILELGHFAVCFTLSPSLMAKVSYSSLVIPSWLSSVGKLFEYPGNLVKEF